jgi:hypothetical protein
MSGISIGRSIAVVVAALLLLGFIDQTLERTLVMTLAQAPVQDAAAYLTIRNRPAVLAFTVVTHALAQTCLHEKIEPLLADDPAAAD